MKTIGYEGKYRVRPNYRRIAKTIGIIYLILAVWSPTMVIKHFKAVSRFITHRKQVTQVALVREQKGHIWADWLEAKLVWQDFGRAMKKAWTL